MAKRFQPMKEFGRTTKKPKLDITINRGRPPQLSQVTQSTSRAASSANGTNKTRAPSPVKCSPNNNNDLWDDDDDDVILLATQVAETEAAAALHCAKSAPPAAMIDITQSEITFSEFVPHVHASTSTQQLMRPPERHVPHQNELSEMFGNDDDDDFVMLAAAQVAQALPLKQTKFREESEQKGFKIAALPCVSSSGDNRAQVASSISSDYNSVGLTQAHSDLSSQSAARRQLASERQIKFLMERVDVLKKENSKLTKDLSDNKMKMESKEGEAALLRDELRHMKQQMQTLKMEKIFSTEAAKTECKNKIAELSKKVEAKETELQLKSVEFSVLKMRHANETQRLQITMQQDESMMTCEEAIRAMNKMEQPLQPPSTSSKINTRKMRSLMRLRALTLDEPQCTISSSNAARINELIYEQSNELGGTRKQRTLFQCELENMQIIVAQLQLVLQHAPQLSDTEARSYVDKTLTSVRKVFPEFWTYVHSLEFPKNCRVHPQHEYDLRLDKSKRLNLHQPYELHAEERAISLRRYVAALSVVCGQLPSLTQALLSAQHGEYLLLQIASDAIGKLGFSRELCEHFGLLEAFTVLLQRMLLQVVFACDTTTSTTTTASSVNCSHVELLVGLLKQLAFTRPSAWIFRELSYCLLSCLRLPSALELLCVNSHGSSFVSDRVRSLYRFSNESCLLQVYAGLLEIAFPLNTPLQPHHFELLTVICANHVHFVYACFANPPKFIRDLLPSYDTDDEDNDDDAAAVANTDTDKSDKSVAFKTTTSNDSTIAENASRSSSSASIAADNRLKGHCEKINCECYTKLCQSLVTLLYQVLRQWLRADKLAETSRVATISKISVQLLHIIFCDNYLTSLFRDAEETTKHYLCLICKWWSENAELLDFNEIHTKFLNKLQKSHVMPKKISDEEQLANVVADLKEWHNITSDLSTASSDNISDNAKSMENLKLIEEAGNAIKFFEGLKGYAFNFQ